MEATLASVSYARYCQAMTSLPFKPLHDSQVSLKASVESRNMATPAFVSRSTLQQGHRRQPERNRSLFEALTSVAKAVTKR